VVPPPLSSNTAPQPQPTKSQRDLPTPRFAPTALLSCPLERSTSWSENELCGVATLVGGGSNDGEAPHFGLLSVEVTMAGGGKAGLVGRRSVLARGEAQEVCRGCRGGSCWGRGSHQASDPCHTPSCHAEGNHPKTYQRPHAGRRRSQSQEQFVRHKGANEQSLPSQ
jgi:hypothetical protein